MKSTSRAGSTRGDTLAQLSKKRVTPLGRERERDGADREGDAGQAGAKRQKIQSLGVTRRPESSVSAAKPQEVLFCEMRIITCYVPLAHEDVFNTEKLCKENDV